MPDEQQPPPQMPPLPERIDFPYQLLKDWVEVPEHETIEAVLTRQDIDNLLFGLLRSGEAITALEQSLVLWSQGKLEEANKALAETRRLNIESQNRVRRFFTGLMVAATRGRGGGGGR